MPGRHWGDRTKITMHDARSSDIADHPFRMLAHDNPEEVARCCWALEGCSPPTLRLSSSCSPSIPFRSHLSAALCIPSQYAYTSSDLEAFLGSIIGCMLCARAGVRGVAASVLWEIGSAL